MAKKFFLIFKHPESDSAWIEGKFDSQEDVVDYLRSHDSVYDSVDVDTVEADESEEFYHTLNGEKYFNKIKAMNIKLQHLAGIVQNPMVISKTQVKEWLNSIEVFDREFKEVIGMVASHLMDGKLK